MSRYNSTYGSPPQFPPYGYNNNNNYNNNNMGPNKSSYPSSTSISTQGYPQYSVNSETCLFTMKPIMPTFRFVGSNNNGIALSRKGRMLLTLIPRSSNTNNNNAATFHWDQGIGFALSVEEIGILLSKIGKKEQQIIEFIRSPPSSSSYNNNMNNMNTTTNDSTTDDIYQETSSNENLPDKKLTIVHDEETKLTTISIDFVNKDGIGGQSTTHEPLKIDIQEGSYEVIKAILQDSIISLAGWKPLMETALENALTPNTNSYGGGGGGNNNIPF